jgi:hypothetical protein
MDICTVRITMKLACRPSLLALMLCTATHPLRAQTPAAPAWAQPGSATHVQVAPPPDFHRSSKNFDTPIGIFDGQSDIGSALLPGSASYDAGTRQYAINSAGYNVWYTRDEFRYLWKKMSGDVSLAADIAYPDPNGYGDRKAVLVIRQDLDDDSMEAITALHGLGMIHLAQRPQKGARIKDMEYRIGGRGRPGGASPDSLVDVVAKRIGIEKHGDSFALFVSLEGEPVRPTHQLAPRRDLLRRHRLLLAPAGQVRYCRALPCRSRELRRQGPLGNPWKPGKPGTGKPGTVSAIPNSVTAPPEI